MRVPFQGGIGVEYFRIWMVFFGFAIGFPISGLAQQNDAVLLCFESSQNPACKRIHPTLTRLVAEGTPVRQVDVLEERFLASRFGVRLTPTFIVLCGGEEVTRLVGVHSTDQLKRALLTTRERSLVPTRSVHERHTKESESHSRNGGVIPNSVGGSVSGAVDRYSEVMPNRLTAHAIERARSATVRLRVYDSSGYGVGTGTMIDSRAGEVLILTCGHLFRDAGITARIEVDIFRSGMCKTVLGKVIDYDAETRDIALVSIRTEETVEPVKIAALYNATRSGDPVFSFGCDRGSQPTRLDTRITGVNKYDQHLGLSNYEIQGAPIDGRSGGGLFDQYGRLVGVCNAADYREDIGIYAGIGAIHWQLERIGLASLIPLQN